MKKILIALAIGSAAASASAQQIGKTELEEIRSSFERTPETVALQNVISGNTDISKMALNRELQGKIDHYMKYRVDVSGITDQKRSGRCWMFTSMNVLRPDVMKKFNISEFDFSHNYNYFWDIFEKSNLFLENVISTADRDIFMDRDVAFYFQNPLNDGGVWNLFFNIAGKYGVVPAEVMPETAHSNNTGALIHIVNERLRAGGYSLRCMHEEGANESQMREEKMEIMKDIYRVLSLCLGEPPVEFTWRYRTKDGDIMTVESTPVDFYRSIIPENYNPQQYIMIMNDPTREYYKVYEIDNYRNTEEGINWIYLNLPNEEIKKAALASIKDNEAMYASCDVNRQVNVKTGIADPGMYDFASLFGINLDMDKKARILTRQSGSAHAMTLIGVDTDENDRPVKWEFENSWGTDKGNKGYLTFTDEWFDEYMFRIVINRKYLSEKAIKAAKGKPVLLPAWDYMF